MSLWLCVEHISASLPCRELSPPLSHIPLPVRAALTPLRNLTHRLGEGVGHRRAIPVLGSRAEHTLTALTPPPLVLAKYCLIASLLQVGDCLGRIFRRGEPYVSRTPVGVALYLGRVQWWQSDARLKRFHHCFQKRFLYSPTVTVFHRSSVSEHHEVCCQSCML